MRSISPKIIRQLHQPKSSSHKGDNGVLYIAAGSRQYHGSLWFAIEIASHFVDLIYVETDTSNHGLVQHLKKLHPAIILVSPRQRSVYLHKSDCVLLGPGLGRSAQTKRKVQQILRSSFCPDNVVIDADALYYLTASMHRPSMILTPHAGEYRALFGTQHPQVVSRSIPDVIVKKGPQDAICQKGKCEYNTKGTAGLTKGGTGDVLAAFIAALACTHSPWVAGRVGCLLEGLAAEDLAKVVGTHFSTIDLINQIPLTFQQWQK